MNRVFPVLGLCLPKTSRLFLGTRIGAQRIRNGSREKEADGFWAGRASRDLPYQCVLGAEFAGCSVHWFLGLFVGGGERIRSAKGLAANFLGVDPRV